MGEKQNGPFQLSFNALLKVGFQGSRVTSDGGPILVRELDERLGFGDLIAQHPTGSRRGKNTQLPLADLLRQSVCSRMAGYEDVNDAERLSQDPTFRPIGSEKIWDRGAALTSRLQTFETEMLAKRLWLSFIAYNLGNLWRRVPSGPGVAEEDRELTADQLAAKAGENRRSLDQARAVLLAAAGREPSGQATVWEHGTADRCAEGGYRVAGGR